MFSQQRHEFRQDRDWSDRLLAAVLERPKLVRLAIGQPEQTTASQALGPSITSRQVSTEGDQHDVTSLVGDRAPVIPPTLPEPAAMYRIYGSPNLRESPKMLNHPHQCRELLQRR